MAQEQVVRKTLLDNLFIESISPELYRHVLRVKLRKTDEFQRRLGNSVTPGILSLAAAQLVRKEGKLLREMLHKIRLNPEKYYRITMQDLLEFMAETPTQLGLLSRLPGNKNMLKKVWAHVVKVNKWRTNKKKNSNKENKQL